jgi:predicted O-methyltransferase YrrM
MSIQLISKELNDYSEKFSSPESPALAALNRETNIKRGDAVMLSGHLQGAFLQMLSRMIRPRNVLEIGTYTGYSAICLAEGLQDGGVLHTIDINEELEDMSSRAFEKAGLRDKIVQHIGKAADIIPSFEESFDLVFIDADKIGYANYYDLVFDKVPVGGYIVADNVLYEGEVALPEAQQSKNAKAMHHYNQKIKADTRVCHLLLPLRDGLMIVQKIKD